MPADVADSAFREFQMSWRESILEVPCVAEGDEFNVTFGSGPDQSLAFLSLGKLYRLVFKPIPSTGEIQASEYSNGWKRLGRFESVLSNADDPAVFSVVFSGNGFAIRQNERVVLHVALSQPFSQFVNIAGTSSVSARILGAKRYSSETNLKLPNDQLNIIPMIHYSRSGSTVVGRLLPQDRIAVLPELYSPDTFIGPRLAKTVWVRARDAGRYSPTRIEALFSKMISANRPWLLNAPRLYCEIKLNLFVNGRFNFDPNRYFHYLQKVGVEKVVFLHRRNLLRRLVSARISLESGTWHIIGGTPATRSGPVTIDVDRVFDPDFSVKHLPLRVLLDRTSTEVERFRQLLKSNFQVLELWYEDHVERDPNVAARTITELYGVPYTAQPPRVIRQNPGALSSLIVNFDDVYEALIGSPYEYMLEESSQTANNGK